MPSKSDRLDIVKKLAERKEATAAANLQKAQKQLADEQQQYEQVQDYYQEYLSKSTDQNHVSIDELTRMRGFTHRLSTSVAKINDQILDTEKTIDGLQNEWVILRHRRKVLEELIENAKREELAQMDKRDQKALDELVTQQWNSPNELRNNGAKDTK